MKTCRSDSNMVKMIKEGCTQYKDNPMFFCSVTLASTYYVFSVTDNPTSWQKSLDKWCGNDVKIYIILYYSIFSAFVVSQPSWFGDRYIGSDLVCHKKYHKMNCSDAAQLWNCKSNSTRKLPFCQAQPKPHLMTPISHIFCIEIHGLYNSVHSLRL